MREVEYRSSSHRSRHRSRSRSRDRGRDRDYYSRRRRSNSRSRPSKSKKKKSKKKRYRSSSNSSTSSRSRGSVKSSSSSTRRTTTRPTSSEENSMTVQGAPPPPPKDLHVLSNFRDRGAIAKIEDDSFTSSPFFSSAENKKISDKVIIDLKNDTISVEEKEEDIQPEQSLLFHPNFIGDEKRKMEKWVKKLYNYRQKAFQE